jgi:uncharacterized BrkB/YihY/UPF0761 family membrane protein
VRLQKSVRRASEDLFTWARARVPGVEPVLEALDRERLAGGWLLAGGLAYRLFFWLVPLGLVVAAVLSFWESEDPDSLENAARDFGVGQSAVQTSREAIEQGAHSRWYFLIVGLALLIWFARGVVRALNTSFAVAWGVPPERVRRPFLAGIYFTLLVLGVASITAGTQWAREQLGATGLALTIALVAVYAAGGVWLMARLPNAGAPWTDLVPGALLLAVGTQAMHLVVTLYLVPKLGRSSQLYGSLGAATVILLWLYFTARLITGSAFLNSALWYRKQRANAG